MRIVFDELRGGLADVAANQVPLLDVTEEAILVMQFDQLAKFVIGVRAKIADMGARLTGCIQRRQRGKAVECIEAVDTPCEIFRFQDRTELEPAHEAEAAEYTALNDAALYGKDHLVDLIHRKKALQLLASCVARESFQFVFDGVVALLKQIRNCGSDCRFLGCLECSHSVTIWRRNAPEELREYKPRQWRAQLAGRFAGATFQMERR